MPPPSSVASVRASCEVANLRIVVTEPRQLEQQPVDDRLPGAPTRHDRTTSPARTSPSRISQMLATTPSEMPTISRVMIGSSRSWLA
jgi:hypothetical protein